MSAFSKTVLTTPIFVGEMTQLHSYLAKWLLQYAWDMGDDANGKANDLQNEGMDLFQAS